MPSILFPSKSAVAPVHLNPGFSAEAYVASQSYKNVADRVHLRDILRLAGLPE